jgi:hypothetical protein
MSDTALPLRQVGKEALTLEIINRLESVKSKLPTLDEAARERVDALIAELTQGLVEFAAAVW